MIKLLIIICTRGDSIYLEDLLNSLRHQIEQTKFQIRIGVSSNTSTIGCNLQKIDFLNSAPKGFASARQHSLKLREAQEAVIFLDDDNLIPKFWLESLIGEIQKSPKSLLKGRVGYLDTDFVALRELSDGLNSRQHVKTAGMSNLYIPSHLFDSNQIYFDTKFDKGGEDTELTHRLTQHGYSIKVSNNFSVFEIVNDSKSNSNYLIARRRDSEFIFSKVIALHSPFFLRVHRFFKIFFKKIPQILRRPVSVMDDIRNHFGILFLKS